MSDLISEPAFVALRACIATRGPHRGSLLSKAPSPFKHPEAYAAWQAAMMCCNPYKVSMVGTMLIKPEHRPIYDEILAFFDANPRLAGLDHDRRVLALLGVW